MESSENSCIWDLKALQELATLLSVTNQVLSEPMKCKGVGSLIQTLRGFGALEDASWCEEEERVLGVRMPWGSPQLWGLGSEEERCKRCWRSAGRGGD